MSARCHRSEFRTTAGPSDADREPERAAASWGLDRRGPLGVPRTSDSDSKHAEATESCRPPRVDPSAPGENSWPKPLVPVSASSKRRARVLGCRAARHRRSRARWQRRCRAHAYRGVAATWIGLGSGDSSRPVASPHKRCRPTRSFGEIWVTNSGSFPDGKRVPSTPTCSRLRTAHKPTDERRCTRWSIRSSVPAPAVLEPSATLLFGLRGVPSVPDDHLACAQCQLADLREHSHNLQSSQREQSLTPGRSKARPMEIAWWADTT